MSNNSYKYLGNCIWQNEKIADKDDKTTKWSNIEKEKMDIKLLLLQSLISMLSCLF